MADSVRASKQGLEIVNRARRKKGWTKTVTPEWWQKANTTQATLKRFWRRLSCYAARLYNDWRNHR